MFKIKKQIQIITIITLTALIVFLALGCGGDDVEKCKVDSDCTAIGKCSIANCVNGICKTSMKSDCCGNRKCEKSAGENKCTCSTDCGKCEGIIQIEDSRGRLKDGQYLQMLCNENDECTASYETQKATEFYKSFLGSGFTFDIFVKYDLPFDKQSSKFNIEANLKDMDPNRAELPIVFKAIRIMEGSTIIGRTSTQMMFDAISKTLVQPVGVSYTLSQPEETKSLVVEIDYEYSPIKRVRDPQTNQYVYAAQPISRNTYRFTISDKITLVDGSIVE